MPPIKKLKKVKKKSIIWNAGQQKAIDWNEGPVIVSSCAGSGKSSTAVYRIKRLLQESRVAPNNLLATTFTKKAAKEMDSKLFKLGVNTTAMNVQTFHSFCYQLIRKTPEYKEWKVDDKDRAKYIVKSILGYKHMNWKNSDSKLVLNYIASQRNQLISPKDAEHDDFRFVKAYFHYDEIIHEKSLLTFDDMIYFTVNLLKSNDKLKRKYQNKIQYLIVDEFQDVNKAQMELCDILAYPEYNFMCIGDLDQCQPPGTMVTIPGEKIPNKRIIDKQVPIETLQNGDSVRVWNRPSAKITGSQKISITSRNYNGLMYTIHTKDYSTKATPDHKFFVRWKSTVQCWVVYLMYREDRGFRVGWCKLFTNSTRLFHLRQRTRLEYADKSWILKVFDNKIDASVYESIVSIKWQIPTAMFQSQKNSRSLYNENALQQIFKAAKREHGIKCLHDHNLNENYPIYTRNCGKKTRNTIFITQSCNIIPNLMLVPVNNRKDDNNYNSCNEWQDVVNVKINNYNGKVYSLDVPKHENYIADNIITHNCIYTFRGSVPEFMLNFQKKYNADIITLDYNYRCPPNIFNNAFHCVKNNKQRLTVDAKPFKKVEKVLEYAYYPDPNDQACGISEKIKELAAKGGLKYKDIYILLRTNAQSRPFEEVFTQDKIPFVINSPFGFYDRREIKSLISYLRLSNDPYDVESGRITINVPFRFVARKYIDKIVDYVGKYDINFLDACIRFGNENQNLYRTLMKFTELVEDLNGMKPKDAMEFVVEKIKYFDWVNKEFGKDDIDSDKQSGVEDMISSAHRFKKLKDFLDYVDEQIVNMRKNKKKKNRDAVEVMTLHKCKGLENKVIFLPDANDGIIPHKNATNIEEERRIWYVGMTRAEECLFVSSTARSPKSQFLSESNIKTNDENDEKSENQK